MIWISTRTVIVSNLIQLALAFGLIVLAALMILAAAWIWAGFPTDIKPITTGLESSSLLVPLIGAVSVIPSSVMAGYVAGRMAHHRPILHGALSSCAWLLLLVLIILFGIPTEHPPHAGPPPASYAAISIGSFLFAFLGTMVSIGTPLLGALGGMIFHRYGPVSEGGVRYEENGSSYFRRSISNRTVA